MARGQERIDELGAASIRALARRRDCTLHERRLWQGRCALPVSAPHLAPFDEPGTLAAFRGAADGMALRMRHSRPALHERGAPTDPLARTVFEWLEQLRCESLAPRELPGIARNLRDRHQRWAEAFHRSLLTETEQGLLLFTLALVSRARIEAEEVDERFEGVIEPMRMALAPCIGHAWAGLRRERSDQARYGVHACAIAEEIADRLRQAGGTADTRTLHSADVARCLRQALFPLAFDADGESRFLQPVSADSRVLSEVDDVYRIFTTAYDEELEAATLVRAALRQEYRERLDRRIAQAHWPLQRLARTLHALFTGPARDGWDDGHEAGHIDGRRLAQLIASPAERRLFRNERQRPTVDAVVSFLVDCSGSMKAHAEPIAMMVDVFSRALEQAGAASEVLGFTTAAWNGGRALADWQRAGRPRHPGRLNELRHLVFKEADTHWRRARPGIASMLKPDLFREGVDGEAVDWACRRLAGRVESQKVLVVVSDGSPMDRATGLANDAHYLDQHLRDTVARWECAGVKVL
ncbi:MAG TPA: cobalt chelatase, partial [Burkholderiaceae bacterium]|nr:cobalt chelatase [Burkholderiaceae bacterium]